ncbi:MAG: hypothetical protein GC193_09690 [Cryomorphaceae bacterium]|nr:hypothetical protein [Cryomorphaceae bacterium]
MKECPNYTDGFFIIPNYHLEALRNLTDAEKTPKRFRELGHEIKDHRVVVEKYPVDPHSQEFNSSHGPTISKSGQEFSDMFVFGAGASAFCCFGDHKERYENDQWRSPLGYDIFNERYDELCTQFDGVKQAIPEFELKNNNIEECLEADWNKYCNSYIPELTYRHINIQFYLQKLFQRISKHTVEKYYRKNLYQLFTGQIKTRISQEESYRPVIVNFNYDTILDQFLDQSFGYSTIQIDEYIDWHKRSFVHFKPHGSSNWGWKFPQEAISKLGNNIPARLYRQKTIPAELFYSILGEKKNMVNHYSYGFEKGNNTISKHSLDKLQIQVIEHEFAYPALLLPFKDKDEFVMPYHHQTALGYVMSDVKRIFIIGWKGSEQLFLEKLKNTINVKEVVIADPQFEVVKRNLAAYLPENVMYTDAKDFESFIKMEII